MHRTAQSVEEIFSAALEIDDPDARSAYLDESCADPELRRRVEQLLAMDGQASRFLEAPAALEGVPFPEGPGSLIGPYKLLEQIGEGGMGVVYMAEQTHPMRRKVALKIIKPGMDTKQVIARFEAERQALAMMDHPNISRVLDASATESGRPYFVMELVRGIPITEYCDQHRLSIAERLDLFALVCQAVQHAHQKGIIHRDIKPSNVLITLHDGVPVPKVIDFGIAKATGLSLTDKTLFTGFSQFMGTPLYMSPEQAELSGIDVDTRSDIYSLGVLLYELLAGTTPFDAETLRKAALDEVRRIIREQDPPTPSTRLSSLGDTQTTVSANRGTDPRKLNRSLRGELDWIVMKALEKDRRRRYETASAFAADVARYRNYEPVEACPPSAWYRFKKSARRHRVGLTTGALVSITLIAGTTVSLWQAIRARGAEKYAIAQRNRARNAVDEMYTQVAERWLSQQAQLEPLQREFLLKALAFYQDFAREQAANPRARQDEALAYKRVGNIQLKLENDREAEQAFRRALEILEPLATAFPNVIEYRAGLADNYHNLGSVLEATGRHALAERALRRAVKVRETLASESSKTPEYRDGLVKHYVSLGSLLLDTGRPSEGEQAARHAVRIAESLTTEFPTVPEYRVVLTGAYKLLSKPLRTMGRLAEAERVERLAIEIDEALAAQFPRDRDYRSALATSYRNRGVMPRDPSRATEARQTLNRALEIQESLAAEYPEIPEYRSRMADIYHALGDLARSAGQDSEMERTYRLALGMRRKLAAEHTDRPTYQSQLAASLNNVANVLMLRQRQTEVSLRSEHDLNNVAAVMLTTRSRNAEARKLLEEAIELHQAALETNPRNVHYRNWLRNSLANLIGVRARLGDSAAAIQAAEKCVDLGVDPAVLNEMAWLLATDPPLPDAVPALALARMATGLAPKNAGYWNTLGVACYRAGDWSAAISALEKSMELNRRAKASDSLRLANASPIAFADSLLSKGGDATDWFFMAMARWQKGEKDEARSWFAMAVAGTDKYQPKDPELRRFRGEAEALINASATMPNGTTAFAR
jgi:eukaryotic-like serine/threonine-protein kinase